MFWLIYKARAVEWIQLKFLMWVRLSNLCSPITHLPTVLIFLTFCLSSEQRFQRAGVTLDHEALQSIIRFLLLTFRHVLIYLQLNVVFNTFIGFDQAVRRSNYTFSPPTSILNSNNACKCIGQVGRTTSLQMNFCQSWKKAVRSGPKRPFRCCMCCGANMVHQSTLSRKLSPCSALLRYVSVVSLCSFRCISGQTVFPTCLFCCSLWTSSGSWGWPWVQTRVGLLTRRTFACCWRSPSPLGRLARDHLRWPSHSSRSVFVRMSSGVILFWLKFNIHYLFFSDPAEFSQAV